MAIRHIGFIMDGNRRWAVAHNLPRIEGYTEGLNALKRVVVRCSEMGVEAISVYAFSTENWARPKLEVEALTRVAEKYNRTFDDDNLKIKYMGSMQPLSRGLRKSIEDVQAKTANNKGLTLNIAFNYGGRADVVNAAALSHIDGDMSQANFEKHLGSFGLPPLDMIVRTGGEMRLSGFMLYESEYAELMFLEKQWPDMNACDMDLIAAEFERRKRKFGV